MIDRIKIFGERNTGTNFAELLIGLNHPGLRVLTHGDNNGLNEQAAKFGAGRAPVVLERLIDARRAAEFPENFGWKHAAPAPDAIRAAPAFAQTCFLFLVRNPFQFLTSLARRPYNLILPDGRPGDMSGFLRGPILLNQRDGLAVRDGVVANPVQLWSLKTAAHRATAAALGKQALLLRYEDLVADPTRPARWLATLGHRTDGVLKVPAASTKGDALSFSDYQARTRDVDPVEAFSPEDRAYVVEQIDQKLCADLGYSL